MTILSSTPSPQGSDPWPGAQTPDSGPRHRPRPRAPAPARIPDPGPRPRAWAPSRISSIPSRVPVLAHLCPCGLTCVTDYVRLCPFGLTGVPETGVVSSLTDKVPKHEPTHMYLCPETCTCAQNHVPLPRTMDLFPPSPSPLCLVPLELPRCC